MKISQWFPIVALAGQVTAIHGVFDLRVKRSDLGKRINLPTVPSYNMTIPIDHFSDAQQTTYQNRYYVNDTYYQPGGPVILLDNGETAASAISAAEFLGGLDGIQSAAMRLAEEFNGVTILWEHRYFGASLPVTMNYTSHAPASGVDGYKYLTVDQALEDLAFFANNFNTTTLDQNSNIKSTANLDPYHTPWIIVGGSYPGMRAAWARQRHPEVFYAAWSSSAPVEARFDGSIIENPIYRALPSNCTTDIQGAFAWLDKTIDSGDTATIDVLNRSFLALVPPPSTDYSNTSYASSANLDNALFARELASILTINGLYQSRGPTATSQAVCDLIESFDANAFSNTVQTLNSDNFIDGIIHNPGNSTPASNGLVANSGNDGGFYGIAALIYAAYQLKDEFIAPNQTDQALTDSNSWIWLSLNQMGYFQGNNDSSRYHLGSKYWDVQRAHDTLAPLAWPLLDASQFPATPNTTEPLAYGGWNIQQSNTMFTNGEFDGWRAFGVSSEEQEDAAAPKRTLTSTAPACNVPPNGTDVFGTVYAGAVHAEDIIFARVTVGNQTLKNPPLQQGLDMFVPAFKSWRQCFNQSRDDIRNGKGADGKGDGANGGQATSKSTGSRIYDGTMLSLALFFISAICLTI